MFSSHGHILKEKKKEAALAFNLNDLQALGVAAGLRRSRGEVVPVSSLSLLQSGAPHCPQRRPLHGFSCPL